MAVDLNKLIADAKKEQAAASKAAAKAKQDAEKLAKDSKKLAEWNLINNYIETLMKSSREYEATLKRYAGRIAKGDKLDFLEKQELELAKKRYTSLQSGIAEQQKKAYNVYTGRKVSPEAVTTKLTEQQKTTTTTGVGPTGDVTVKKKITTKDTEKPTNVNDFIKNARPLPIVENMPDGKDKPTGPVTTPGKTDTEIMAQAQSLYGNIDEIFNTNEELKALIRKAVENKYEPDRFLNELEGTSWFKTNAGPIRQRGFYKRQYDDLVNKIKKDDPNYQARIAELDRTSEYGRGLQDAIESVTADWTSQYGTPTAEDLITIRTIASDLYQYANETDPTKIRNAVLSKPKTIAAGGVAGGAMGQNLQTLRSVAEANGLNLDKDFKTSVPTWMDRIAKGESIETIKSLIRNAAKTTWNVNDRVANLLDQGVDLASIYSPYRTRMSTLLEIAPDTISFSDLASKGVIGGKEEKNLYDFEKELRRDSRWQYTKNARDEVSSSVFQVLRDFGFQG